MVATMATIERYDIFTGACGCCASCAWRERSDRPADGEFLWSDRRSVRRASSCQIWKVKGRSEGKPILLLIGDESQLGPLVRNIPPAAGILMKAFWPGPFTNVFPAVLGLSDAVTANSNSVGIRLDAWQPLVDFLDRAVPVTGTSANREGTHRLGQLKKSRRVSGSCAEDF